MVSPHRTATVGDVDALAARRRPAPGGLSGLPAGALVGLAAPNGPGFLASLLALRRAGLAALLLDAQTPEAEALRTARALGAAAVLGCRSGWPQGPADLALSPVARRPSRRRASRADIAVVKLTSGSTGAPRGIATPAEALVADDAALTATMGLRDGRPPPRHDPAVPLLRPVEPGDAGAAARHAAGAARRASGLLDPFAAAAAAEATVFPTVPAYLRGAAPALPTRRPGRRRCAW